ncbi:MAG: DUF3857 domain-containing protein [Bacteroidota bacterium]|nr:DUF3857 domain-containing protein [Bacteroidota bacterium]
MRNFIILILVLLIFINVNGQKSSDYGNTDAVYKEIKYEYTLNPDGSTIFNYEHKVNLLTGYSFTRVFGEDFISYNPLYQKVKITKSVTTMADGKQVPTPKNGINEVLPGFASGVAPYNHLREVVVSHTGIEKNSSVDFGYTIETKPGMIPGMTGKVIIGGRCPINKMSIIVRVPKGKMLKYNIVNGNYKPVKANGDKFDTYTWIIENIPQVEVEHYQPEMEEFSPVLFFSTCNSKEISEHIFSNKSDIYDLGYEGKAIVDTLLKNKASQIDRAIELKNYVVKNVANMICDMTLLGYKPMKAKETFSRNSGSQLDKAILLSAMLEYAGIKSKPVFVSNTSKEQGDISFINQFNTFYVLCEDIDKYPLFLDPCNTQSNITPDKLLNKYYIPFDNIETGTVFKGNASNVKSLEFSGELNIDKNLMVSGKGHIELTGFYNFDYTKDKIKSFVTHLFKSPNINIKIKEENINQVAKYKTECNFEFTSPVSLMSMNGTINLQIPGGSGILAENNITVNPSTRHTPIELGFIYPEEYKWKINIPENMKLINKTLTAKKSNEAGQVLNEINVKGNNILITRKISMVNFYENNKAFSDLKELLEILNDKNQKSLYISY